LYVPHTVASNVSPNHSKEPSLPDIKTIQDDIRARLAEIERLIEPLALEAAQLTKLVATFEGASPKPAAPAQKPARRRATTTRRNSPAAARPKASDASASAPARATRSQRGRPSGGGNRAQQAVEHITKQPGITASELAAAMGIGPNYLYRVLPQLVQDAKINKQGRGYHPAGVIGEPARAESLEVSA